MYRLFLCRLFLVIALALQAAAATAGPLGPDGAARIPGKFVWFDLATEDPQAAKAFYGAVFGWKFREAANAPANYAVIENASGKVGGIFRHTRPSGATAGSRWLSMVSVKDPAQVAAQIRQLGGEVLLAPRNVPGRGTHAVFRDPEGAAFGVIASEGGDPPDTPVADGDVFWLDLYARDPARAAAFYAAIANLEVDVGAISGEERTLLSSNGYARAGIARLRGGTDKPGWLPYVLVEDVPATLARARKAGGKVLMPPRATLLGGNLAVIADPLGGAIGIVDPVGVTR
jgi:predicted enzyme related to lactoylglutathione lyase